MYNTIVSGLRRMMFCCAKIHVVCLSKPETSSVDNLFIVVSLAPFAAVLAGSSEAVSAS